MSVDRSSLRGSSPRPIRIAGGGVAGLFLGLRLCQAGIPVTILESGAYPRHRVCGEFIAGAGESILAAAGIHFPSPEFPRHRDSCWILGDRTILARTLPREALGVSRYSLDLMLAKAFEAAGGTLRENHRARPADLQSPGTVWATGRRACASSPWIGLAAHFTDLETSGLSIYLGRRAYVGVSEVEKGRVNVCGLFHKRPTLPARREETLDAYLRASGLAALADRLRSGRMDPASFAGVAAFSFAAPTSIATEVALGDRFGVIPPFTGDGMSLALESAEAALPALERYAHNDLSWPDTATAIRLAHEHRFRSRYRWARILHPFLLHPSGIAVVRLAVASHLLPFRTFYARTHAPFHPCISKVSP